MTENSHEGAQRGRVTDQQRAEAAEAIQQLKRDLAEAAKRPRPPVPSPGKFTGPVGLDADGNLQPPLTPEEEARKAERHRRAAGRDRGSGWADLPRWYP